jgi:hypothetical protein
MGLPRSSLRPSWAPFHDIVPNAVATPINQITLPVTFWTRENFCNEHLQHEVSDSKTAYTTFLGRPTLTKFMVMVAPEPHENLQFYISATSNVVSTAIVIERGESETNPKIQYLVYFISEVLSDSKTRYFHIMKLAYALLITSCKLSHYFQAHLIDSG